METNDILILSHDLNYQTMTPIRENMTLQPKHPIKKQ